MDIFKNEILNAIEKFNDKKLEKEEKSKERLESSGKKFLTEEEKQEAKKNKKEAAEKAKAYTKMLVGLAEIGSLSSIKEALLQGASIEKSYDRKKTPLIAALENNHVEMAYWLINNSKLIVHHGFKYYNAGYAAIVHDNLDVLKLLVEKQKEILNIQDSNYNLLNSSIRFCAPRCFKWLYENNNILSDKNLPINNIINARGLGDLIYKSLKTEDFDKESFLDFIKEKHDLFITNHNINNNFFTYGYHSNSIITATLNSIFRNDDANSLIKLLKKHPDLVDKIKNISLNSLGGSISFTRLYRDKYNDMKNISPSKAGEYKKYLDPNTKIPLILISAEKNAELCVNFLLNIPTFKNELIKSQTENNYLWEDAYTTVTNYNIYKNLKEAGFDFKKLLPQKNNYLHALLATNNFTKTFAEKIGRDLGDLSDKVNENNKTPIQMVTSSYYLSKNEKAFSAFNKAAIRTVTSYGSRKKTVKEAAKKAKRL